MSKIELTPDTFNDITTPSGVADTDLLSIEYDEGYSRGGVVYLFIESSAPTDISKAKAKLICDDESIKSVRTIQGVSGSKVYAYYGSNNCANKKLTVLVG